MGGGNGGQQCYFLHTFYERGTVVVLNSASLILQFSQQCTFHIDIFSHYVNTYHVVNLFNILGDSQKNNIWSLNILFRVYTQACTSSSYRRCYLECSFPSKRQGKNL